MYMRPKDERRTANDIIWSIPKEITSHSGKVLRDYSSIETRVGTPHILCMPDGEYPVYRSKRMLKVSNGRVNTRNVKGIVADQINRSDEGFDHIFVERIGLMADGSIIIFTGS
jgi:hypothetical protein